MCESSGNTAYSEALDFLKQIDQQQFQKDAMAIRRMMAKFTFLSCSPFDAKSVGTALGAERAKGIIARATINSRQTR